MSRRNISGFILFVLVVPVSLQSKSQKSVLLSGSEAEYIALSKAVKEGMFFLHLLRSTKISIKLQVMVRVDKLGTTFMASNIITMSLAKMWTSGTSM